MLLADKRILVTGVLNDASIAFSVARLAQEQGAEVVLSSFGRAMRLTERTAKRLPDASVKLVELDVTNEDDLAALADNVGGRLDGVVHSLAFAPESCLGGGFLDAPWTDVSVALPDLPEIATPKVQPKRLSTGQAPLEIEQVDSGWRLSCTGCGASSRVVQFRWLVLDETVDCRCE